MYYMKSIILFSVLIITITACNMQKVESQKMETINDTKTENRKPKADDSAKNFVLVELFTSEGCSSCPPADKVLSRLGSEQPVSGVEIVPLALHVDYWNYLGWKDEFSDAAYSRRQSGYAEHFNLNSSYTPQMVIDGQKEFVGSNFDTAVNAVKEAAKMKRGAVEMEIENGKLNINISDLPKHDTAYVLIVITEDDLQTNVKRGENSGRKLSHTGVVRELKLVGNVEAGKNEFQATADLNLQNGWKKDNLNVIVFVQGQDSKSIFAVGKTSF